ncbi:glycoside hydrolase superfamily [Zopfochytrium polystomum]|nr:glycoside hydrolase superfamily [Zopfochytrium polystomum]
MMPSPRPPNPTRTLATNTLLTVYFLLLLLLPLATTAAAPTDPFLLGPWLNTGEYPHRPWKGEPTVLQVEDWDDGTGAAVFMTVYADSPAYVWPTDDDLTAMATKLRNITDKMGRAVFLRYLPEMNGVWMTYGLQPAKFVENWKNMTAVVRRVAPAVQIVWSPNFDLDPAAGGANYWPGADYVDWVGISHYWKSSLMGYPGNVPVPAGDFSGAIDYVYKTFAVAYNKPFVLSEASYGWEEPLKGGAFKDTVTEPEAQKSYWTQVIDAATSGSHPLFRMAFVFEYKKVKRGKGGRNGGGWFILCFRL